MSKLSLTYPQLDLPTAQEVTAFRQIVKVLRSDPVFGRVINPNGWSVWDGSGDDTLKASYATCPYCQVSPFPTESSWITEGQHLGPLVLRVTLAVAGTNFDQIGNLWGAFRSAIFPQNNPARRAFVDEQLREIGRITKPTIQVSAYGEGVDDTGAKFLTADGTIRFGLLIST